MKNEACQFIKPDHAQNTGKCDSSDGYYGDEIQIKTTKNVLSFKSIKVYGYRKNGPDYYKNLMKFKSISSDISSENVHFVHKMGYIYQFNYDLYILGKYIPK